MSERRRQIDVGDLMRGARRDDCFICALARGAPKHPHHVVYEDALAIAFLNRFPVVRGYTIVAPREHREHVTGDFTEDEYVQLQRFVHRVGEAVRRSVPTERLYLLSLGSRQGNSHVHWHVAPLPPGVPYEEQQFRALELERGVLDVSDDEMAALAERLRRELR